MLCLTCLEDGTNECGKKLDDLSKCYCMVWTRSCVLVAMRFTRHNPAKSVLKSSKHSLKLSFAVFIRRCPLKGQYRLIKWRMKQHQTRLLLDGKLACRWPRTKCLKLISMDSPSRKAKTSRFHEGLIYNELAMLTPLSLKMAWVDWGKITKIS